MGGTLNVAWPFSCYSADIASLCALISWLVVELYIGSARSMQQSSCSLWQYFRTIHGSLKVWKDKLYMLCIVTVIQCCQSIICNVVHRIDATQNDIIKTILFYIFYFHIIYTGRPTPGGDINGGSCLVTIIFTKNVLITFLLYSTVLLITNTL